jgi:hypothetical protein
VSYQYRTDDLVREMVLARLRSNGGSGGIFDRDEIAQHMTACPDVTVKDFVASDGTYGCETGCEYARLEAVLSCPHHENVEYEYGEWGELADMIEEMERIDGRSYTPAP